MDLRSLLDDRLLLVTGKGGTGKTTYSAALAGVLAAGGRRTVLCEVDNQSPSLVPIFGGELGFTPRTVAPRLDVCNLVWPDTLVAYLERMVGMRRIVEAILGNDMVRRFLDFVPGSQELVVLSVIADLLERYDVVVVDLPASGHAFSLLDITRSALRLFRAGPVRQRVLELRKMLQDARTRAVLVALPEEMVVNETLETLTRLRAHDLLSSEPVIFLNRASDPTMTEAESELLDRLSAAELGGDAPEFLEAGRWERDREKAVRQATARISVTLRRPPVLVPLVRAGDGGPKQVVAGVARALAEQIGVASGELAWT